MLSTYEQHYKTYKDMQERQQQKLTPPKYGENKIQFHKRKHAGYIIIDDREYQDANSAIRAMLLFIIAMGILAALVIYLPGVHFEDIFAGGVK